MKQKIVMQFSEKAPEQKRWSWNPHPNPYRFNV